MRQSHTKFRVRRVGVTNTKKHTTGSNRRVHDSLAGCDRFEVSWSGTGHPNVTKGICHAVNYDITFLRNVQRDEQKKTITTRHHCANCAWSFFFVCCFFIEMLSAAGGKNAPNICRKSETNRIQFGSGFGDSKLKKTKANDAKMRYSAIGKWTEKQKRNSLNRMWCITRSIEWHTKWVVQFVLVERFTLTH